MTTEADLHQYFKYCGAIGSIIIRCSAGVPLAGPAHSIHTPQDKQYATILFNRPHSVVKALQLDNTDMQGHTIKVRVVR